MFTYALSAIKDYYKILSVRTFVLENNDNEEVKIVGN